MTALVPLIAQPGSPCVPVAVVESLLSVADAWSVKMTPGLPVRAAFSAAGIDPNAQPVIILVGDRPALRGVWDVQIIPEGTPTTIIKIPLGGGGGGGGGSNPLRLVLTIALMAAGAALGAWLAPIVGTAIGVTGSIGLGIIKGLIGGVVSIVGSVVQNMLFGQPAPSLPSYNFNSSGGLGSLQAPSPTYSLDPQGSTARLGQVRPVLYGRHKVVPDFAAKPWAEYDANGDQFLHHVLAISEGEIDLDAVYLEDTPIEAFDDIDWEMKAPGESVTLFETDVVTSVEVAGQELLDTKGWVGPYVLTDPLTDTTTRIGIDVECPRGLYYANTSGGLDTKSATWSVEARAIDDVGQPAGTWIVLGTETLSAATNNAIRRTYLYTVPEGRYEVRATRTDAKDTSSRAGHELRWTAAKAHLSANDVFDITVLAVRMKATDQLTQRNSRLINVVATRKLRTWDEATGWSSVPVATRSPAWAAADALTASYGGQLQDHRIDLKWLARVAPEWMAEGLTYDAVHDSQATVWQAVERILRVARCKPFAANFMVRFHQDRAQPLPRQAFGPRNIVKGSLSLKYTLATEEMADIIVADYWDERVWRQRSVAVRVPGRTGTREARIRLHGVTSRDRALELAGWEARNTAFRRIVPGFRTEFDGLVSTYGTRALLTSATFSLGQGGEVVGWDPATLTARLSEPVKWDADAALHGIAFRYRNGALTDPIEITPGGTEGVVVLAEAPPADLTIDTGGDRERTFYALGAGAVLGDGMGMPILVTAITPRERGQVEITAVADDPRVYDETILEEVSL